MQLHYEKDGFLVKGWARDAREVMATARVLLAPLRFGAGLKGKLTEAMLCGTPSVTTNIGAEGILANAQERQDWNGRVIEDVQSPENAQAFAASAIELYESPTLWQKCQQNGDQILATRFDQQEIQERVKHTITDIIHNLTAHRKANFIGAMLQHQTMKATQYMAQWIEEKNKA